MKKFIVPVTSKEANERINQLKKDAIKIQKQLSSKNNLDSSDGYSTKEFWEWRKKAISALNFKNVEIKFLKRWLENPKGFNKEDDIKYVYELLMDSYTMLCEIVEELGKDITKGELDKMNEIKECIDNYYDNK